MFAVLLGVAHLVAQVTVDPNSGALPGGPQLQQITNGLAGFGLIGAVAALIISSVVWAFGSHSHNPHNVSSGKKGVMFSAGAAGIIGASAALINFFVNLGGQVS